MWSGSSAGGRGRSPFYAPCHRSRWFSARRPSRIMVARKNRLLGRGRDSARRSFTSARDHANSGWRWDKSRCVGVDLVGRQVQQPERIGSPKFLLVQIRLSTGTFKVEVKNGSAANLYVESATLIGKPLNTALIHHAHLSRAARRSWRWDRRRALSATVGRLSG